MSVCKVNGICPCHCIYTRRWMQRWRRCGQYGRLTGCQMCIGKVEGRRHFPAREGEWCDNSAGLGWSQLCIRNVDIDGRRSRMGWFSKVNNAPSGLQGRWAGGELCIGNIEASIGGRLHRLATHMRCCSTCRLGLGHLDASCSDERSRILCDSKFPR